LSNKSGYKLDKSLTWKAGFASKTAPWQRQRENTLNINPKEKWH